MSCVVYFCFDSPDLLAECCAVRVPEVKSRLESTCREAFVGFNLAIIESSHSGLMYKFFSFASTFQRAGLRPSSAVTTRKGSWCSCFFLCFVLTEP